MNILFPKDLDYNSFLADAKKSIPYFKESVLLKIYCLIQSANIRALYNDNLPVIHNSKLLAISHRYNFYTSFLADQGIINIGKRYIVGKQSKSYSFTQDYPVFLNVLTITRRVYNKVDNINTNYEIDTYNHNNPISFDLENEEKLSLHKPSKTTLKTFDEFSYDYTFLKRVEEFFPFLAFNAKLADTINEEQFRYRLKNPTFKKIEKWKVVGWHKRLVTVRQKKDPYISLLVNKFTIANWKELSLPPCVVDNTSYRFHSPISAVPKIFRPAFRLNGEELVSLDLQGSQPFLALVILNPGFWYSPNLSPKNKAVFKSMFKVPLHTPEINLESMGMLSYFDHAPTYSYIMKKLKTIKGDLEKDCIYCDIYLNMLAKLMGTSYTRSEMKKAVFEAMFSSNYTKSEFKSLFEKLYPEESSLFTEIKKGKTEFTAQNGKQYNPWSVLPILLQRIESYIFIHHIAREIITKHPNTFMVPLHDSIVTTKSNEEFVKEIIVRNIQNLTGFTPTIKSEYWA